MVQDQVNLEQADQTAQKERRQLRRGCLSPLGTLALAVLLVVAMITFLPSLLSSTTRAYHSTEDGWLQVEGLPGGPEAVQVSASGTVWVSTTFRGGLSRFDGTAWRHYSAADFGTAANYLWGGFALVGEEVWGATDGGAVHFDGQAWQRYPEALAGDSPRAIAADTAGVWVVDRRGNLSHFDGERWTISSLREALPAIRWNDRSDPDLTLAPDGSLWLAQDGLWRFDGAAWTEVLLDGKAPAGAHLAGVAGGRIWSLDDHDLVWLSFDGTTWGRYRPNDLGLPASGWVYQVAAREGQIWAATSAGLLTFDGTSWQRHSSPSADPYITGLALAPDGTAWVLGQGGKNILQMIAPLLLLLLLGAGVLIVLFVLQGRSLRNLTREQDQAREVARRAVPGLPAVPLPVPQRKPFTWKQGLLMLLMLIVVPLAALYVFPALQDFLYRVWPAAPGWLPWAVFAALLLVLPELIRWTVGTIRARTGSAPVPPAGPPPWLAQPPAEGAPTASGEELPSWLAEKAPLAAAPAEKLPPWLAAGAPAGRPAAPPSPWPGILRSLGMLIVGAAIAFLVWQGMGALAAVVGEPLLLIPIFVVIVFLLLMAAFFGAVVLPPAWVMSAVRRGNHAGALRRVQLLRRLRPRSANPLFLQGTALDWAGRHEEAEQILRDSIIEEQGNNPGIRSNALANLGCALTGQGRYDEAVRAFEGAIEIGPMSIGPYEGLAEAYLRQGIYPERALDLLERSQRNLQASFLDRRLNRFAIGELLADRAWALALQGRHLDAAEALEQAFSKADRGHRPAMAGLHYRAAQVKRLRGDRAAAAEHLAKAVQLDPEGQYGRLVRRAPQTPPEAVSAQEDSPDRY